MAIRRAGAFMKYSTGVEDSSMIALEEDRRACACACHAWSSISVGEDSTLCGFHRDETGETDRPVS